MMSPGSRPNTILYPQRDIAKEKICLYPPLTLDPEFHITSKINPPLTGLGMSAMERPQISGLDWLHTSSYALGTAGVVVGIAYLLKKKSDKNAHVEGERDKNANVEEALGKRKKRNSKKKKESVTRIGNLKVFNKEIAKGSDGAVVFEGVYGDRSVAVKRLPKTHYNVASREIKNLYKFDSHPNIITIYGVEEDEHFVYLSLQRCICSLEKIIEMQLINAGGATVTQNSVISTEDLQNIVLYDAAGRPAQTLLQIMRDVVKGLVYLHERRLIHRDLKPQNILIIKDQRVRAKLADMGISKLLPDGASSLGSQATGSGSCGWKAPERLCGESQTQAIDLFSLGCVLFYCITGGKHPFGNDWVDWDSNIKKSAMDLFLVQHNPEALDLLPRLLHRKAEKRPQAVDVLAHPLFWTADKRLSFLCEVSALIEDKVTTPQLLGLLESRSYFVFKARWDTNIEVPVLTEFGHGYNFFTVRDLLRAIRNKFVHRRELPHNVTQILGKDEEAFDSYIRKKFPKLVMEVYEVLRTNCSQDHCLRKYYESS